MRKSEYRIQILLFGPTIWIVFEYQIIRHTLAAILKPNISNKYLLIAEAERGKLFLFLSFCLSVCMFRCRSVRLSVYLSVRLFVGMQECLYVYPTRSVYLSCSTPYEMAITNTLIPYKGVSWFVCVCLTNHYDYQSVISFWKAFFLFCSSLISFHFLEFAWPLCIIVLSLCALCIKKKKKSSYMYILLPTSADYTFANFCILCIFFNNFLGTFVYYCTLHHPVKNMSYFWILLNTVASFLFFFFIYKFCINLHTFAYFCILLHLCTQSVVVDWILSTLLYSHFKEWKYGSANLNIFQTNKHKKT